MKLTAKAPENIGESRKEISFIFEPSRIPGDIMFVSGRVYEIAGICPDYARYFCSV